MSFDDAHRRDTKTKEQDDELPFALMEQSSNACQASSNKKDSSDDDRNRKDWGSTGSSSMPPPGLASSIMSHTDGESQSSSPASSSLLQSHTSMRFLDTAASLLSGAWLGSGLQESRSEWENRSRRMMEESSSLQSIVLSDRPTSNTALSSYNNQDSEVGFSQLLEQASDHPPPINNNSQQRLPVLLEDQSFVSIEQSRASLTVNDTRQRRRPGHETTAPSQPHYIESGGLAETIIPVGPESSIHRSEDRRLASLAGAFGSRTGDQSFVVSVELSPSVCTVQEVMDILGNPDMLPLWCDSIRDCVITQSSEGPRDGTSFRNSGDRQYEGEWIEASCSKLLPPSETSCLYRTSQSLASALGFSNFGRIHMFVERQRGQVGITMGPFPGSIELSHRISVFTNPRNDKVKIVDTVSMQRDMNDGMAFCGLWEALENMFLPKVEDYLDQCLSSMARLRFLAENGEQASMYVEARSQEWSSQAGTPLLRC